MKIQDKSEPRELVPIGNYTGVIVGIYDLGTQTGDYGDKRQVVMSYELHKKRGICRDSKNKVLVTSKFYSFAFGKSPAGVKSKLRVDVESILGRTLSDDQAKEGVDLFDLADKTCRVSIMHEAKKSGGGEKEVLTITTTDEDDATPTSETDTVLYDLAPGADFLPEVPEWIQGMVKKSKEWVESGERKRKPVAVAAGHSDDPSDEANNDDDSPF